MADSDVGTVRLHANQDGHQFIISANQIGIIIDIKDQYSELARLRMGTQRRKHVVAQMAIGA